jgi:hypothetical protein
VVCHINRGEYSWNNIRKIFKPRNLSLVVVPGKAKEGNKIKEEIKAQ